MILRLFCLGIASGIPKMSTLQAVLPSGTNRKPSGIERNSSGTEHRRSSKLATNQYSQPSERQPGRETRLCTASSEDCVSAHRLAAEGAAEGGRRLGCDNPMYMQGKARKSCEDTTKGRSTNEAAEGADGGRHLGVLHQAGVRAAALEQLLHRVDQHRLVAQLLWAQGPRHRESARCLRHASHSHWGAGAQGHGSHSTRALVKVHPFGGYR